MLGPLPSSRAAPSTCKTNKMFSERITGNYQSAVLHIAIYQEENISAS